MGEYFDWVNVDKKEYLCPADFDLDLGRHGSVCRENCLLMALHTLLSHEWDGDRILFLGDECRVQEQPDCEAFRVLNADTEQCQTGHYFCTVMEAYRNVSGLFQDAEAQVRQDIRFYLEDMDDFRRGRLDEPPVNEYGVDIRRPFAGLFSRAGSCFPYVVNYTKKVYYSLEQTRILYLDRSVSTYADPLSMLLAYGRDETHGSWVGDRIGVSDAVAPGYALIEEIVLDW